MDPVLSQTTAFTEGGVNDYRYSQRAVFHRCGWYGWSGAGGSWFIFSPSRNLGVGYAMTGYAISANEEDPRTNPIFRLIDELTSVQVPGGVRSGNDQPGCGGLKEA